MSARRRAAGTVALWLGFGLVILGLTLLFEDLGWYR